MIVDKTWTLFLDRDGVINKLIENGYVYKREQFTIKEDIVEALAMLRAIFGRIIVVTNQQGIGKGLYTEKEVEDVHRYMQEILSEAKIFIDKIYYCPALEGDNDHCRKPNLGMAEKAKADFPEINFQKSIMIGDSYSDLLFGKRCGMTTVFISDDPEKILKYKDEADFVCPTVLDFARLII